MADLHPHVATGSALKQMTDMQPCSKVLMQGRLFSLMGDITVLYFGTASYELQAHTCKLCQKKRNEKKKIDTG